MGWEKALVACSLGAFLLLVAACSSSDVVADPDPEVIISDEDVRPEIPSRASAQLLRETRVFGDPAPLMSIQSIYGVAPVILDPGTYEFDALGTTLTLTFADYWRLESEAPGSFAITRPTAELEALLPAVTFHRPVGFADPALAGSGGPWIWYMQDIGEWIEAIPQLVVLDSGELTVGDRSARWWDIDVDPSLGPTKAGCEPGRCVDFLWSGSHSYSVARDLERIRWYEIPDPAGPIIVFISTDEDDFGPISAEIDTMLGGASVGPSTPNPVAGSIVYAKNALIEARTPIRVAGVSGLEITAPYFLEINQRPGEVVAWRLHDWRDERRVGIAVPATDTDGQVVASVAAIVAEVEQRSLTFTATDEEILGQPAVRIDFEAGDEGVFLLSPRRAGYALDQAVWPDLPHVRAWVFESPTGPAIVFASGEDPSELEDSIDDLDWFVDMLAFCEPTDSCGAER